MGALFVGSWKDESQVERGLGMPEGWFKSEGVELLCSARMDHRAEVWHDPEKSAFVLGRKQGVLLVIEAFMRHEGWGLEGQAELKEMTVGEIQARIKNERIVAVRRATVSDRRSVQALLEALELAKESKGEARREGIPRGKSL